MLHGQTINYHKLAAAADISIPTLKKYLAILTQMYMVRMLEPATPNLNKRLAKSPKIYLRDSGILHALLEIDYLLANPMAGASWEGFVIENIITRYDRWRPSFLRTSNGAEIDLMLERADRRHLFECKLSKAPKHSRGFYELADIMKPESAWLIAPVPVQLIPKSNTTAGFLAHIAVSKFADGLPLYRQQKTFDRLGIEMSRAVMAKWMVQDARHGTGLLDLLRAEIRGGPLIGIDESPLNVLNEAGRANTSKSYMWVYRGGRPDRPVLLYDYQRTRSGKTALAFLDGYRGYIQSDDFAGYDYLDQKPDMVHLGCWAPARRKFVKVAKVRKKHRSKRVNPKSLAEVALDYIGKLYRVEKEARQREFDAAQIYQLRQEKAKPLLDEFKDWLETNQPLTPPKGLLGQAISYTLANWPKLIIYIEDGRLKPDNNLVENAIRPFVVGRKNWLFAGSPDGAKASAAFFTLIETAKANGLEPYAYLRNIFEKLPHAYTEQDLKVLLP